MQYGLVFLTVNITGVWYYFHIITEFKILKDYLVQLPILSMNSSTKSLIRSSQASAWTPTMMSKSFPHKVAHFAFRKPNSLPNQRLPSWNFCPLILVLLSRTTQRKPSSPSTWQFFKYLKAGIMFPQALSFGPFSSSCVPWRQPQRRQALVWILNLSHICCVTLSKLFNLSVLVSSYV